MIYEKKIYHRDDGMEMECLVPIDPLEAVKFRGTGLININHQGQLIQQPFFFDIPGASVTEAYANFPAAMKAAAEAKQAEVTKAIQDAERKIIVAPPGAIPNGRRFHG